MLPTVSFYTTTAVTECSHGCLLCGASPSGPTISPLKLPARLNKDMPLYSPIYYPNYNMPQPNNHHLSVIGCTVTLLTLNNIFTMYCLYFMFIDAI